jgi:small GTP-binding protein
MDIYKVFLYGLDYAGKTAISMSLRHGETITKTKPTLSFNIDKIIANDLEFQIWDAPGQPPLRRFWKRGFDKAKTLVFVLDTANKSRYQEAKEELLKILDDPLTRGIPLVFCYHKIDLPEAKANLADARKFFNLKELTYRKLIAYETSICELNTLKKLESTLVNIAMGIMW